MQNIILISNLRTIWPTIMLPPYLRFSDNLLQDAYIIKKKKKKKKKKDNFETGHQSCLISVWGAVIPQLNEKYGI